VSGTGRAGGSTAANAAGTAAPPLSSGISVVTAAHGLTTPQPIAGSGKEVPGWSAVSSIRRFTCAALNSGRYDRTNAATPATNGAA
jgi:hypothetical protein